MATAPARPRPIEELLQIPATHEERMKLSNKLIATWFRPLVEADECTENELNDAETRLGAPLPKPLRDWYRAAGHARDIWSAQDVFIAPDKLTIGDKGEMVLFRENQDVVRWGIDDVRAADP